jgi:hypothetical protein
MCLPTRTPHPVEAELGQRALERLALRVEDLVLQHHVDQHAMGMVSRSSRRRGGR